MADQIDLTGSPPPPSRSLRLRAISRRRTRSRRPFKGLCLNCALRLIANNNRFQARIHAAADYYYVPLSELGAANLYPLESNLNEAWIPEHELLMVGLIKYWRRRLTRIASNVTWDNKTTTPPPPQVQSFSFGHQPSTFSYYATSTAADLTSGNENLMAASDLLSNPMIPTEPQPTLPLFPEKALSFSVPPAEEWNGSTYGFQIQTGADSTLMTGSDEGDFDLELHLG